MLKRSVAVSEADVDASKRPITTKKTEVAFSVTFFIVMGFLLAFASASETGGHRIKVTGYRCVPRARASASFRSSNPNTANVFIYARALITIYIAIYNARASAGCSQVARQRPF